MTTGVSISDVEKTLAKEYNLPVVAVESAVGNAINGDAKIFPLPHMLWYVIPQMGDDIEIASDYIGGDIDIDRAAVNKYLLLDEYQEVFKDFPRR